MKQIIVVGGNFAGLTSALELKRRLGNKYQVLVISKSPFFLFVPSLTWIPFSRRTLADITLPLEPITAKAKIEFVCAEVTEVVPKKHLVKCGEKEFAYDYLVIATGPEWIFDQIEGMSLDGNISYVVTPDTAMITRDRWEEFVKNPGSIVIGSVQGAQFVAYAYEILLNVEKRCRDLGIRDKVDITFLTPEPFLGHLGIGGITGSEFVLKKLLTKLGIKYVLNSEIAKVTTNSIYLTNGTVFPYQLSIIMPKFKGPSLIENSAGLGDAASFLPVNAGYQHVAYPYIFGVGAVTASPPSFETQTGVSVPKTGYAANMSAKIAAYNIIHLATGEDRFTLYPITRMPQLTILDGDSKELICFATSLLRPRSFSFTFPNLVNDFSKVLVEKYFLWKMKHGYSWLL